MLSGGNFRSAGVEASAPSLEISLESIVEPRSSAWARPKVKTIIRNFICFLPRPLDMAIPQCLQQVRDQI